MLERKIIGSNMVPVNITSPHRTYFTCTGEHFLTRHSRTRLAVRHWRGVIFHFRLDWNKTFSFLFETTVLWWKLPQNKVSHSLPQYTSNQRITFHFGRAAPTEACQILNLTLHYSPNLFGSTNCDVSSKKFHITSDRKRFRWSFSRSFLFEKINSISNILFWRVAYWRKGCASRHLFCHHKKVMCTS